MTSIIIHPQTKQQIKVFEQMAKALNIAYEVANTSAETNAASAFMKEFNAGVDVETAREKSLQNVRKLWQK